MVLEKNRFENCHVKYSLSTLTEQWRKCLDNTKLVGAVLMDLSKAFHCLPHDLLTEKLLVYDFDRNTLKQLHSYLKNHKQAVKVKGFESILKDIISGVPRGSILGPVLFNIFINNSFYFVDGKNLHNFADDNTLSDQENSIGELSENLQYLSEVAIDWMDQNNMIANPSKISCNSFIQELHPN